MDALLDDVISVLVLNTLDYVTLQLVDERDLPFRPWTFIAAATTYFKRWIYGTAVKGRGVHTSGCPGLSIACFCNVTISL